MVGLVSGYESSDDEQTPVASSSKKSLPTLVDVAAQGQSAGDDDEDDDAIEAAAATDAFGLATSRSNGAAKAAEAKAKVSAAPDVLKEDPNGMSSAIITRPTDQVMNVNISYADMQRPVAGPEDPFNQRKNKGMNSLAGHVEEHAMDDYTFMMQQRTFETHGYALNPSTAGEHKPIVGSLSKAHANGYQLVDNIKPSKSAKKEAKRKRGGKGDASVTEGDDMYMGPWAAYAVEKQAQEAYEHAEEDAEEWRQEKKRRDEAKEKAQDAMKASREEKTIFHGKELRDYAGRTYMHIPTDLDVKLNPSEGAPPPNTYVPERCIHTWTGHNKGVTKIELFPTSGHLLLSGSLDTKIKLWDVYHEGNCLRTFMGHGGAVKDISFNNNGTQFLSCSYDKYVKIWDTETGQCVQAFSSGKVPNVAKFNPDEDKQHIFLAGMQDKKIIQYDTRMKEIVQTYDQHLGPVNTLTFVDENRRFLSTSDDKSIRGWDWDIPVVIKYIAEPYMHSMPAVTPHPNGKFVACQSLDNQILIYTADGTFRQVKKKRFAGHTIAGYACNIGFAPDGKYISSGTGAGDMVFWDWKTGKIVKRLRCHDQVVIDHAWLPNEPLVTASWDGLIKLWT